MNTDYQSLPRLKDSISYVYLEHSIIEQEDASRLRRSSID